MSYMWKIAIILGVAVSTVNAQANGFCTLAWNDEFNAPKLDTSIWQMEQTCSGNGNNELQCYTNRPQNVYMDNGKLVLKAIRETYTGSQAGCTGTDGCTGTKRFTSGRVNSAPTSKGAFLRGRMEIRAKLVSGSHLWPAIWMLPQDWSYGGWAASGEIDIMEARGQKPQLMSGTLHHGGAWPNNKYTTTGDHSFNNQDLSLDYHTYGIEWTETYMNWFVDNTTFQSYKVDQMWNSASANPYSAPGQPWDKRFHFIFNVAVGGNFFGGDNTPSDAAVAAWQTPEMRIDYVRVWNKGGDCSKAQDIASTLSSAATAASTSTQAPVVPTTSAYKPSGTDIDDIEASQSQEETESGMSGQTVVIISASIGGAALLIGVAGIIVGVILILKAKRNLMVPQMTPSGSQEKMLPYSV